MAMTCWAFRRAHNRKKGECTFCGEQVPKNRRNWCSNECYNELNWPAARHALWGRDKGVCSCCGTDTEKMKRIKNRLWWNEDTALERRSMRKYLLTDVWGIPRGKQHNDWWEGHHIVARKDGGSNKLENLQTLCFRCHAEETKRQQQRWAAARRRPVGQMVMFG